MKKLIAIFSVFLLLCSMCVPVYATPTDEELHRPDLVLVSVSEETAFYPSSGIQPLTHGVYPLYTRVTTYTSASSGIIKQDSATGTLLSIGSLALSFMPGVEAMTVSTIFSVTGLVVSQSAPIKAETYISYRDTQRQGEARWSDETTYTPWVYTGKREWFKHVLSAELLPDNTWHVEMENYTDAPCAEDFGTYYNYTDSQLKELTRNCAIGENMVVDLPW